MIETSHPIPSRADDPKMASMVKSTPSKSCLIEPLIKEKYLIPNQTTQTLAINFKILIETLQSRVYVEN